MNSVVILAISGLLGFFSFAGCQAAQEEKKLVKTLLSQYEKIGIYGRPGNSTAPIDVTVGFSLLQILGFDQFNQVLTLVGWLHLEWTDINLSWEPEDFDNIDTVHLPLDLLWHPDVVLFNTVDRPVSTHHDTLAVIKSDGKVVSVRQYLYKVMCVTNPEQKNPMCKLKYGSWSMATSQMNLVPNKDRIEAGFYTPHLEWELGLTQAKKSENEYTCCPGEKFSHIEYSLKLELREPEPEPEPDNLAVSLHICPLVVLTSVLMARMLL